MLRSLWHLTTVWWPLAVRTVVGALVAGRLAGFIFAMPVLAVDTGSGFLLVTMGLTGALAGAILVTLLSARATPRRVVIALDGVQTLACFSASALPDHMAIGVAPLMLVAGLGAPAYVLIARAVEHDIGPHLPRARTGWRLTMLAITALAAFGVAAMTTVAAAGSDEASRALLALAALGAVTIALTPWSVPARPPGASAETAGPGVRSLAQSVPPQRVLLLVAVGLASGTGLAVVPVAYDWLAQVGRADLDMWANGAFVAAAVIAILLRRAPVHRTAVAGTTVLALGFWTIVIADAIDRSSGSYDVVAGVVVVALYAIEIGALSACAAVTRVIGRELNALGIVTAATAFGGLLGMGLLLEVYRGPAHALAGIGIAGEVIAAVAVPIALMLARPEPMSQSNGDVWSLHVEFFPSGVGLRLNGQRVRPVCIGDRMSLADSERWAVRGMRLKPAPPRDGDQRVGERRARRHVLRHGPCKLIVPFTAAVRCVQIGATSYRFTGPFRPGPFHVRFRSAFPRERGRFPAPSVPAFHAQRRTVPAYLAAGLVLAVLGIVHGTPVMACVAVAAAAATCLCTAAMSAGRERRRPREAVTGRLAGTLLAATAAWMLWQGWHGLWPAAKAAAASAQLHGDQAFLDVLWDELGRAPRATTSWSVAAIGLAAAGGATVIGRYRFRLARTARSWALAADGLLAIGLAVFASTSLVAPAASVSERIVPLLQVGAAATVLWPLALSALRRPRAVM
jgi:hypothetical protein